VGKAKKEKSSMKKDKVKLSLKAKLVLVFILIITIPTIVLALGAYVTSTQVVKDQFEDLVKSLGEEVNSTVEKYFQSFENGLSFMANDSNVQSVYLNADSKEWMLKTFENYINNYSDVTNIYLGTERGEMFVYPKAELPPDFDPRKRDWYIETVQNKELTWVSPYIDTATKELVISAGVPIYDPTNPSRLLGVLGIDVKLDALTELMTSIKVGQEGYPILYNKEGIVLIHKNKDLIGSPSTVPKLLEAIQSGNVDFIEYDFNDKGVMRTKLGTISVLSRLDWRVVSTIYLDEITSHTSKLLINNAFIGGVSIVVAIIVALLFANSVTKPIKSLSHSMEKVKEGDFTIRPNIKSKDEIGLLGESFNIMIDNLANLINVIKNVSFEVTGSSEQLAATSEETSASSEEVTRTVEEIAKGASEQAQDSETGVMLVTNLANKFNELSNSSNDMFSVAKEVMDTSINSVSLVEELRSKTELNNIGTNEIEKQILNLDEKINFIGTILQTIDSIAEQTNLLALNASIEAARAGEYGKGFAVVAEEIRKLSYDSRESSDRIKDIIGSIQNDSKETVVTMKDVKQRTVEQSQAVTEVNNAFNRISSSIDNMAEKIEVIGGYVNEMNSDKDKIVESIENISAVSEETAAASQEVTASMEEQSSAVHEVAEAANRLNELALKLNEEISRFSI